MSRLDNIIHFYTVFYSGICNNVKKNNKQDSGSEIIENLYLYIHKN